THLTPLSWGGAGAAAVSLAESWDHDLSADAWWTSGSPPPHGMPSEAHEGLLAATEKVTGDSPKSTRDDWPFFCLPGATAAILALLDGDETAKSLAALTVRPCGGVSDERELLQVQGWSISSVWRNDDVVLKISHPAWLAEPRLTAALAKLAPGSVPAVISHGVITGRGAQPTAYLLRRRVIDDEPGADEDEADKVNRSVAALRALAELQLSASTRVDRLRAAGVVDRDPQRTSGELARLWQVVTPHLGDDERAALPGVDDKVRAGLERLARTPPLVVHGDLHLGNVLKDQRGEPQLIDWTDAAFAWPGVDLYTILSRLGPDEETRESVTTAYVAALGHEFEEAVRLGLELAPSYHALSYLRISDFLPRELAGIFANEVTRLVKRQLEVIAR
ncbi:MAG TPA: aminoglycoside phosphotransferase family protein, partial [Trueperaceae bacterium]|nr:aminoglycoside phosphotransferase family protein [Trueperaceae bacterium]